MGSVICEYDHYDVERCPVRTTSAETWSVQDLVTLFRPATDIKQRNINRHEDLFDGIMRLYRRGGQANVLVAAESIFVVAYFEVMSVAKGS
ncbi:unnamed protein product [Arctia plantaginis]|uniref:Uncharacterized protein n=1 Tax=Arctia plantaginis TaxID=874455 RepID=A0A8S0YSM8_ARCPL|nr:unnamed protein product [Arctia plantaginis]